MASYCIQDIQRRIDSGEMDANDIIDEKQAKIMFNAWRVYFIDRMMEEYDQQGWASNGSDMMSPFAELEYDIQYYNDLVAKENKSLKP